MRKTQIERMENALVARLKARLPGSVALIDLFPDKFDRFEMPQHGAAVFVSYAGSSFGPKGDSPREAYAPREDMKFHIVLLVRNLRSASDSAAYDLLSEIRRALHGHSFVGATPLIPGRTWLDAQAEGVWRWAVEFTASVPCIAEPPQRFSETGDLA